MGLGLELHVLSRSLYDGLDVHVCRLYIRVIYIERKRTQIRSVVAR